MINVSMLVPLNQPEYSKKEKLLHFILVSTNLQLFPMQIRDSLGHSDPQGCTLISKVNNNDKLSIIVTLKLIL